MFNNKMCIRCDRPILVVLTLMGIAITCLSPAARGRKLLQSMPPSVSTVVAASDYPALRRKLGQLPAGADWRAPLLRSSREALHPRLKELAEATGIGPGRLNKLPSGQVLLGLALDGDGQNRLHGLLLVDVSKASEAARALLQDVRRAADTVDWLGAEQVEIQGRTADRFTLSRSGESPDKIFHALLHSGTLAVSGGSGGDLLKKHLRLSSSDTPESLADLPLYQKASDFLGNPGDIVSFSSGSTGSTSANPRSRLLQRLGLRDVRASALSASIGPEGIHTRTIHLVRNPRRGIMKALTTGPSRPNPPPCVGRDPTLYGGIRFDAATLWRETMSALQKVTPGAAEQMRRRMRKLPLSRQDLLDAFGSNWHLYVPDPAVGSGMPRMIRAALMVDTKHSSRLREALKKWVGPGGQGGFKTVSHRGATIYTIGGKLPLEMLPISLPNLRKNAEDGGGRPMMAVRPSIVFLPDRVILASSLELARKAAERSADDSPGPMGRPEVQKLLAHLMADRDGLLLADARKVGRAAWKLVRTLARRHSSGTLRLPSSSAMQSHLGLAAAGVKWSKNGVAVETWLPFDGGSQADRDSSE